jgi:sterol desaturase/sphingolipid hydroxylase (fatty acid hydroxylase superfamily)
VLAVLENLQSVLFERTVLPVLYALGQMRLAEEAHTATGWVLIGVVEIVLVWVVLRPLEVWRPVERWPDRRAVRVDVLYTLLDRVGIIPLVFFFTLRPAVDWLDGRLRFLGYVPPQLEDFLPRLHERPLAAFLLYLIVLDASEYVRHRLQHRLPSWWALHAVHHSQRQLSFWSDDRNHVVDSLIADLWRSLVALLIGVPGGSFVVIVMLTRGIESLAHANVRLGFGALGERLLVGPRYHRLHHGLGVGHEGPALGCNFAVLLPVWDIVFRTADFRRIPVPTGIRDQLQGVDYGEGFWSQQGKALARMVQTLVPTSRRPA